MDIIQVIQQKVSQLKPNQQQEVLDFTEFLVQKYSSVLPKNLKQSSHSAAGCLSHLNVHITQKEIAEIRREMWKTD